MSEEKKTLSKKTVRKAYLDWMFWNLSVQNFERMEGPAIVKMLADVREELYPGDPQAQKEMLERHSIFFNTEPFLGSIVPGIVLGMEHEMAQGGDMQPEFINSIKTALMGPFAGVGDTIVGVLIGTIFGSIAAYMGVNGNPTGVVLWMIVQALLMVGRYFTVGMSYKQGMKMVTSTRDRLNAITQAATLLGITVVGALIASVIRVNVAASFVSGEVTVSGQDVLDQIMPKLLPVLLVAGVYTLLGKKNMTSTKAILIVMVLSIILYAIGFLA